jgi:hypothetical protein
VALSSRERGGPSPSQQIKSNLEIDDLTLNGEADHFTATSVPHTPQVGDWFRKWPQDDLSTTIRLPASRSDCIQSFRDLLIS